MIVTELNGGLGNQLFQYAFGCWLSLRLDDPQLSVDCRGLPQPVYTGRQSHPRVAAQGQAHHQPNGRPGVACT